MIRVDMISPNYLATAIVLLVFIIFGGLLYWIVMKDDSDRRDEAARLWGAQKATIVVAWRRFMEIRAWCNVHYKYLYQGQEYFGNDTIYRSGNYEVGDEIDIFINPKFPSDSVIKERF